MEEIPSMKYSFHPEAQAEFLQAIEYYNERESGLGYDFAIEVHSAIERVVAYPETWPFAYSDIRRCLVRRFPYGILYHYIKNTKEILIVAVMHLHRSPEYWKTRS